MKVIKYFLRGRWYKKLVNEPLSNDVDAVMVQDKMTLREVTKIYGKIFNKNKSKPL